MTVILVICGAVLLITGVSYFTYEYFSYRQNSRHRLSVVGRIIAANSTAALAFSDKDAADEIMESLKGEPHIVAAGLYDKEGRLFAHYPESMPAADLPKTPGEPGYRFRASVLEGYEPVEEGSQYLGSLYLRNDMTAMRDQFMVFILVGTCVLCLSMIIAWILSFRFQRTISKPILDLVAVSKAVSDHHNYSLRARKQGNDELGVLTDALNDMLAQIESQNREITSFNQDLEHKVEERTAELEHANRELESFSYSVSHDLRAPLRRLMLFLKRFMDRTDLELDEEQKGLLGRVESNAEKMSRQINDLLSFARVGKIQMEKKPISMYRIARSISDDLLKGEAGRRVDLKIHHLPDICADLAMMTQVWENLISNAVKYTAHRETAVIEVGAQTNERDIVYCIRDNGSGFDMQYYNKLFKAFERLHTGSEFEGTGVGLAIVQRIIEKHGGRIWAEAEKGVGATFLFSMPRIDEASCQAENEVRDAGPEHSGENTLTGGSSV